MTNMEWFSMPVRAALNAAGTAAVLVGGLLLLLAGCGADDASSQNTSDTVLSNPAEPGFGHVHGLGWNPADQAVYAATHYGVWRIPTDESSGSSRKPVRVADRYQDTMGFTVAGPNEFHASGHPDLRENLPALLGFIVSRDGAETWEPVSLLGEVDFHDLAVSGEQVFGYDATSGRLLVSVDGGRTWAPRAAEPLHDVTVDPDDPGRLLATSERGLLASTDGGAAFAPVPKAPPLVVVDWDHGALFGVDADGVVWAAMNEQPDAGWQRRGRLAGGPQAFTVTPGRLLAADDVG